MGLLGIFKRKDKDMKAAPAEERNILATYANMRVEVTTFEGQLLFAARLRNLEGDTADLCQDTKMDSGLFEVPEGEEVEPIRVRIRGYSEKKDEAVYMEGTVTPQPGRIWKVEDLELSGKGNERAFFRLKTNVDAVVTATDAENAIEYPCRLLNISVGGARIASERRYAEGAKFWLRFRLLEDREVTALYCQVMRIIDRGKDGFEYGCRFLELNAADQDRITQNIFAVQRKQRGMY